VLWLAFFSNTLSFSINFHSSSIIETLKAAEGTCVLYFYFDFRDDRKQSVAALLSSLVFQLSTTSSELYTILLDNRKKRVSSLTPTTSFLLQCLEAMIRACKELFVVIDAIDECHEPQMRRELFSVLNKLVDLKVDGVRYLVTTRDEPDIRAAMASLATHQLFLGDVQEHRSDLAMYIRQTLEDPFYFPWPEEIKTRAEASLNARADGM